MRSSRERDFRSGLLVLEPSEADGESTRLDGLEGRLTAVGALAIMSFPKRTSINPGELLL